MRKDHVIVLQCHFCHYAVAEDDEDRDEAERKAWVAITLHELSCEKRPAVVRHPEPVIAP